MWIHGNSVPVKHLNLIKMSTPEPQIRRGHTHCHTRVPQEDLPTYIQRHTRTPSCHRYQAHIYHTHTETDITTMQTHKSQTQQTHIYT